MASKNVFTLHCLWSYFRCNQRLSFGCMKYHIRGYPIGFFGKQESPFLGLGNWESLSFCERDSGIGTSFREAGFNWIVSNSTSASFRVFCLGMTFGAKVSYEK